MEKMWKTVSDNFSWKYSLFQSNDLQNNGKVRVHRTLEEDTVTAAKCDAIGWCSVSCRSSVMTWQHNCYSYKHTTRRHEKRITFDTTDNLRNLRNLCIMDFWKQHNVLLCCSVVCIEQGRHKKALVRSVTAPCQIRASSSLLTKRCIPNVSSEHVNDLFSYTNSMQQSLRS